MGMYSHTRIYVYIQVHTQVVLGLYNIMGTLWPCKLKPCKPVLVISAENYDCSATSKFFLKELKTLSYCYIENFENHVNLVHYNLKLGNTEKLKCLFICEKLIKSSLHSACMFIMILI